MRHPESSLPNLIRALEKLKIAMAWIKQVGDDDTGLEDALVAAARSAHTMALLSDHFVIAIAGKQGAGKTTLLRNLYDLDGTWLDDNQGRGEVVPVLIVEDPSVTVPQGMLGQVSEDEFCVTYAPVAPAAFRDATQSLNGLAKLDALPKLHVPTRYFTGSGYGFLLLPGYEAETEETREWQAMMRIALTSSNRCILVTDNSALASCNDEILADLHSENALAALPLIAITKTEGLPESERETLREVAAKVFMVPSSACICTGDGADFVGQWRDALIDQLGRQSGDNWGTLDRARGEMKAFNRQIRAVTTRARKMLTENQRAHPTDQSVYDDFEILLRENADNLKADYRTRMVTHFDSVAGRAIAAASRDYNEQEASLPGIKRRIGECVTRELNASDDRLRLRIRDALEQAGLNDSFGQCHAAILYEVAYEPLNKLKDDDIKLLAPAAPTLAKPNTAGGDVPPTDNDRAEDKPSAAGMEGVIVLAEPAITTERHLPARWANQIRSLMIGGDELNSLATAKRDLRETVEILPAVAALFYASRQEVAVMGDTESFDVMVYDAARRATAAKDDSDRKIFGLPEGVVATIGGSLALDFLDDGEINTLPALATAAAKVAALHPAIAGIVVGSGLAVSHLHTMIAHDAKMHLGMQGAILTLAQGQRDGHIQAFNKAIDRVAERVLRNVRRAFNLDDAFGLRFVATCTLAELDRAHSDFVELSQPALA